MVIVATVLVAFWIIKKNKIIGNNAISSEQYKGTTSSSSKGGEIADKLPESSSNIVKGSLVNPNESWNSEFARYVSTSGTTKGQTLSIANSSKITTVYAVSLGDGTAVPVPFGFYYVGGTFDTGVIISDNSADAYDGKTDKTTHSYAPSLKGNQFVWIPCKADEYKKTTWAEKVENSTLWTRDVDDEGYEQCKKYGGFYIARYEAGVANFDTSGTLTNSVTFANGYTLNGATGNLSGGWVSSSWRMVVAK